MTGVVRGGTARACPERKIGMMPCRFFSAEEKRGKKNVSTRTWKPRSTGPTEESTVRAWPPQTSSRSNRVTSCPFLCARYAAERPAMPDPTTATRFRPSPGGARAPGDAPGLGGAAPADGALLPSFFALENIPIGNDYPRGAARGAVTRGGMPRGVRRRARIGSCAWMRADRARRGRGEARVRSDGSRVRGERVWQKARRGALFGFSDLEKVAGTTRRARPRV